MEQSFEGDCQKAPGNFVWVKSEGVCGKCLVLNQKANCTSQGEQAENSLFMVVKIKGRKGLSDQGGSPPALRAGSMQPHFFSKTSGCFFIMHTLCACIPAALTRQTITTLKELLLSLPSIK